MVVEVVGVVVEEKTDTVVGLEAVVAECVRCWGSAGVSMGVSDRGEEDEAEGELTVG